MVTGEGAGQPASFRSGLAGTAQAINEAVLLVGALRTAAGVGLFRRLEQAPMDAADVVSACALDPRGTRLLLELLVSLGLLTCDESDRYRCAVPGLAGLDRLLLLFDGLPETVRTGRPMVAGNTPAGAGSLYAEAAQLLDLIGRPAAELCADHLAQPGLNVLELGAGTALWSRAVARRHPSVRVTTVDLPPVMAKTKQAVATDGLQGRYDFIAGDLFAIDWPPSGSFDLVLLPNLCHLFGPEQNEWLLAQAVRALRPGGRAAVIDILADQRSTPSSSVALYALGLLSRTATGQVYSFASYVQWMRKAGLSSIERLDLGGRPPLTLIDGTYLQ